MATIVIDQSQPDLGIAVNEANASLGSEHGTVIVPDGTYSINTKIVLSSNRTLRLGRGTFTSHVVDDITISFGATPNIGSNISVVGSGWDTILVESDQI